MPFIKCIRIVFVGSWYVVRDKNMDSFDRFTTAILFSKISGNIPNLKLLNPPKIIVCLRILLSC